jgi:hypothetical protein
VNFPPRKPKAEPAAAPVQNSSKAQSAVQDGSKLSSEKTTLNNVEQPLNNVEPKNEETKA